MSGVGAFIPKNAAVEATRWDGNNRFIRESTFTVLAKRATSFSYNAVTGRILLLDKKGNEHSLIDGFIVFDGPDTAFTMSTESFNEYYVRMEDPF